MEPEKNIENQLEQLAQAIPSGSSFVDGVMNRIKTSSDNLQKQSIHISFARRLFMKTSVKFAAAAVILIAVLISINQLGGSIDGASVAWADVLDHINNARSVTYKYTFINEKLTITTTQMQMEPGLRRSENPKGGIITISDLSTDTRLQLWTKRNLASLEHTINKKHAPSSENQYAWLRTLHTRDTKFSGKDEIDGVKVNVFICEYPFSKTTVWVDSETCLPVKIEFEAYPNTEAGIVIPEMMLAARDFGKPTRDLVTKITAGSGSRTGVHGLQDRMTMIYHDFNWNAKLDTSLFSMVPPEGYTIQEETIDASKLTIEGQDALVYALKFWISNTNGTFPDTIDEIGDSDKIKSMLIAKFDKDGDPLEEWNSACAEARKIFQGIAFTLEKKVEKSWGYAGEGVALGQADRVVCWWFDKDENSYKAVFGDLSIKDVTQDQLPIQP